MPVRTCCSQTACDLNPFYVRRNQMAWIKPTFEFVDLCSEVTSYLYHR
jgi:hypothetical protein